MKAALLMLSLLYICVTESLAQKHFCIGTDLAAICHKTLRISGEHAMNRRWSVEGEISFNMKNMSGDISEEEVSHWHELYGSQLALSGENAGEHYVETAFSFNFWTSEAFEGFAVSFGGSVRDRYGPDMTAGLGYSCRIWKGIRLKAKYGIRISESIIKRHLPLDGIRIMIEYAF